MKKISFMAFEKEESHIRCRCLSPSLISAAAAMMLIETLYFASLRPAYSHLSNTISELGETGAPQAHLVDFGFFLPVGLMVWLALWLTHRHMPGQDASLVLLALSGLGAGYVLSAFFPCDPGAPLFGSWRTLVHNAAGLIDYGGVAVGFLLFCRYCAGRKAAPEAATFAIAITFAIAGALGFLIFTAAFCLPAALPVLGLIQRVLELVQFTGVGFVCYILSTRAAPTSGRHWTPGRASVCNPDASGLAPVRPDVRRLKLMIAPS